MGMVSVFWNRMAKGYAKSPVADEASYQHKLEMTQQRLKPDMRVLEVGCGTGSTALVHAPLVRQIDAMDVSQAMLNIAQDKAEAAGVRNVTFSLANAETLTVPDGTYDAVLALSLLHLVSDRNTVIRKMFAGLKPGGMLVTSTVCLGDSMPFAKFIAPIVRPTGLLLRVFTLQELAASMTDAGFSIELQWRPSPDKAAFIIARKPD